jgi:RNA polymerase sigma factor (sigma-70 family)
MEEKFKYKIAEFIKTENARLKNYVRHLIDDTAEIESEDIINDVMLKIFDLPDISIPVENLAAYIYRSIRNRVIDIFKKKKIESISLSEDRNDTISLKDILYDSRYNTERIFEDKETMDTLFSAIEELDEKYREIIILTEFEGKSFIELSRESGIPIGTLLSRKSRAIKMIRAKLNNILTDNIPGDIIPGSRMRGLLV